MRMRGIRTSILLAACVLAGCGGDDEVTPPDATPLADAPTASHDAGAADAALDAAASADASASDAAVADATPRTPLEVASWNLQVFGVTKSTDPTIVAAMADLIRAYDLVAVQEIRDSTEAAGPLLLDAINNGAEPTHGMVLGPRAGRTATQEQLAFYYRLAVLEPTGVDAAAYPDGTDVFNAEPWAARFAHLDYGYDFVALTVRIAASDAIAELDGLPDAITWATNHFSDTELLLLADLAADCTYVPDTSALALAGAGFHWLIDDTADTTVGANDCAYDRIIVNEAFHTGIGTGTAGVRNDFDATGLSDHWPVHAEVGP